MLIRQQLTTFVVFSLSLGLMVMTQPRDLRAFHAAGDPHAGETIFLESCQHCHGPKGKGDGQMAEYLDPPPKNLTSESTQSKTDDELRKVIIEGRPGTAMAGVEDSLEDTELIHLIAYIRTLKP